MVRLDKIDIICPYNPESMSISKFGTTRVDNDEVLKCVFPTEIANDDDVFVGYSRYATGPYYKEKVGSFKGELKISFGSKVLGRDYFDKINIHNIEECLNVILDRTDRRIFNPKEIIREGYAKNVHVTSDIIMSVDKDEAKIIDSLLLKPRKWNYDDTHKNSHHWSSKYYKDNREFKIYNKEIQMQNLSRRRRFVDVNGIDENIFDGTLRLELKLGKPAAIRKGFGISDTRIKSVLSVEESPIVRFINGTFNVTGKKDNETLLCSLKDLEMLAVIERYDYDWPKIEREIRHFTGTNASKRVKVYQAYYNQLLESRNAGLSGNGILEHMIKLVEEDFAGQQAA